jgi:hypothetical protein
MDIPGKNLGLMGDSEISVVNLKCDTRLIGSFREEPGIFPGWDMNKAHWLSVALDGSVEDEKLYVFHEREPALSIFQKALDLNPSLTFTIYVYIKLRGKYRDLQFILWRKHFQTRHGQYASTGKARRG